MKVLFLRADVEQQFMPFASSAWLCNVPARVLKRHGVEVRVRSVQQVHIEHPIVQWADTIVLERHPFSLPDEAVGIWRQQGKRVLLRFDDAYALMPHYSSSWRDTWSCYHHGVPIVKAFRECLSNFDSFSTPSRLLTSDYAKDGNGVYFPNRPDLLVFPQPSRFREHSAPIVLAWGGSIPHRQSWEGSGAAEAVNAVLKKTDAFRLALLCKRWWFPKVFEVPYVTFPWVPIPQYRRRLRVVADVGLAPLSGKYDGRRSWIKVLVYALLGIPWIASCMQQYKECKGGLCIRNSAEDWATAIEQMRDPKLRWRLRQEGIEWAWGQGIADHLEEWLSWLGG